MTTKTQRSLLNVSWILLNGNEYSFGTTVWMSNFLILVRSMYTSKELNGWKISFLFIVEDLEKMLSMGIGHFLTSKRRSTMETLIILAQFVLFFWGSLWSMLALLNHGSIDLNSFRGIDCLYSPSGQALPEMLFFLVSCVLGSFDFVPGWLYSNIIRPRLETGCDVSLRRPSQMKAWFGLIPQQPRKNLAAINRRLGVLKTRIKELLLRKPKKAINRVLMK
jgi:hypothetical protein